jgi:hypothetical protein
MTVQEHKVLENRLRRAAERQGFRMEKSRSRDPRSVDHGTYRITDQRNNSIVKANWDSPRSFGLGLDDVARFLFEDINVLVYRGPEHEIAEWVDEHRLNDEPLLTYRHGSTTGAIRDVDGKQRHIPDGWVLDYGDGDEYILGVWGEDDGAVDQAIAEAREHLRRR